MIDTITDRKHVTGYGDIEFYLDLGITVILMAVQEEGVEYLSTRDGRRWIDMLNMTPEDVLRLLNHQKAAQSKPIEDLAIAS